MEFTVTVKRWIGGSRGKINERTDRDGQLRRDASDKQEMLPTNTVEKSWQPKLKKCI